MSNPKSQTTTHARERKPPMMAQIHCKNGKKCPHFIRGDCRYLHEERKVQHDQYSHKQILPTEADIVARILGLDGFGGLSKNIMDGTDTDKQLAMIHSFHSAIQILNEVSLNFDSLETESLEQRIDKAFSYLNGNEKMMDAFEKLKTLILNTRYPVGTRKGVIQRILKNIQLPEGVDEILKDFDAQRHKSLDPLAQARENPDGIPTLKFLDHLANACGLRDNHGFNEMRASHQTLENCSPYTNKAFLGILAVYEATKEAGKLLEAQRLKQMEDRMVAEARAKLLEQCHTTGNTSLSTAFKILQSESEFLKFLQALSHDDSKTLVSVFGSFMTYLAQFCDKKEIQITSAFLYKTFVSFTESRKVDGSTNAFKTEFFKIVHTKIFHDLLDILHVETSSLHRSQNGSSGTHITVHEIFKYMMKELVDMYGNKVPHDERDEFYKGLVRELLPLAFLISISPEHSNMLAGRWKKEEKDKQTGQLVNQYIKMQDLHEKKSIFFWILINQKKTGKRKQSSETCDTFDKLSSKFTRNREIKKQDGSTESKEMFLPELLFQALREVQKENFLKASEFPYNIQNIQSLLGKLFCVEDNSISVSVDCQDELLMALYYAFGSNEMDPHTRQFSDVKSLMHMRPELILQVVQMCQSFDPQNPMESVIAIIDSLGFNDDQSLEHPLITLLNLISENKSEDLLRRAYDVMSLATTMIDIHNRNDCYFMSLVDALVVVLLTEKFPKVKQFDIVQAVYGVKSKLQQTLFVNTKWVNYFVGKLQEEDSRKARLTDFLSIGIRSNPEELLEVKKILSFLRNILSIHGQQDGSFYDWFKRILPFFLDRNSLVGLLKTAPEFEIDSSEFPHSHECSAVMLNKIKALFEKEIAVFIASQNSKIQWDLKTRMEQIRQIPAFSDRLKALGLTKHASAIANLVNSLFSTLALPHQLDAEKFVSGFPKTKGLSQSDSAELVCAHVLSVIGIVKPVNPAEPVEAVDAVEPVEQKKKSKKKSKSNAEADYKALVAQFTLDMEKFQMMENIVSRAISAIYRIELPKEESTIFKKTPTIQLSSLKDTLLQSQMLDELFEKCLPYWKSPLVRELLIFVLNHKLKLGDVSVRDLYRQIQNFGVSFESSEISLYKMMFLILDNPDAVLSHTDEFSDEEIFEQMKETLNSNFWNDSNTEVEISSPVVERRRRVLVRRRLPEHETSSGGGPAHESEVVEIVEEESVPVVKFVLSQLRRLLENPSKDDAISYMESLSSRDEIEEGILNVLKEEDSTCQSVLEAVNEVY